MKIRLAICFLLTVLMLTLLSRGIMLRRLDRGTLAMQSQLIDFGMIPQSPLLIQNIKLQNRFSDTVKVVNAKPSCGCTDIKIIGSALIPKSAVLELALKITTQAGGLFTTNIVLDLGSHGFITLALRMWILPKNGVVIDSEPIEFGYVESGKDYRRTVTIFGAPDALNSLSAACTNPEVSCRLNPITIDPQVKGLFERTITVCLNSGIHSQASSVNISIVTGKSVESILRVLWQTNDHQNVYPQTIFLGKINSLSKYPHTFTVSASGETSLRCSGAFKCIKTLESRKGNDVQIFVEVWPKEGLIGFLKGRVEILNSQGVTRGDATLYGYVEE